MFIERKSDFCFKMEDVAVQWKCDILHLEHILNRLAEQRSTPPIGCNPRKIVDSNPRER
jgi:hypothetical protein